MEFTRRKAHQISAQGPVRKRSPTSSRICIAARSCPRTRLSKVGRTKAGCYHYINTDRAPWWTWAGIKCWTVSASAS